jgi:glutathione S-transferase
MTIELHGLTLSNYYNKVKIVLLEKGVPFTEVKLLTGSKDDTVLAGTPLGKVPFIRIEDGRTLCESQVIVDYLEARFPTPPLLPADPMAAAKVRELCTFLELHLELVARDLYGQAYFGGSVSDSTQERVKARLMKNIPALQRLLKLAPYAAGQSFTLADAAAFSSLPTVAQATKIVLGEDLLATAGIDWKAHLKLLAERPSVQRVNADRKRDMEANLAARSTQVSAGQP